MALIETFAEGQPVQPVALQLPPFSSLTRLLVIAPHPDDETIAAGIMIQRVRAAGGTVHILLLTAGDNNPWPQRWVERRLRIHRDDRKRWGQRRHGELQLALQRLGVPASSLQALGWPDLGVTRLLLDHSAETVATLASAIEAFQPDLMAIPAPADRHPDHGSAYVLIRLALARLGSGARVLTYLIHGHAEATGVFELAASDAQAATKRYALSAHASQMALSSRRMRHFADRPECFMTMPQAEKAAAAALSATALPWQPPAWLRSLLRLSVADRSGVQTWRWPDAPVERTPGGTYCLMLPFDQAALPRFARLACDLPTPWIFDHWGWREL